MYILDVLIDYLIVIFYGVIKEVIFLDVREVKLFNCFSISKIKKLKWLEIVELENL